MLVVSGEDAVMWRERVPMQPDMRHSRIILSQTRVSHNDELRGHLI